MQLRAGDGEVLLIETHISWVLLGADLAYKIKKPLNFSFLDFSTLEKRHFYCQREVTLNRRLTDEMYLGVVPVRKTSSGIEIEANHGEIIDYCVKMKRMDESRQMNLLLNSRLVTDHHMDQLADILSAFHSQTDVVKKPLELDILVDDFADILNAGTGKNMIERVERVMGAEALATIRDAVAFSGKFLREYYPRFLERNQAGLYIDGHGDLHSRNIFILDKPVIFDCIEFNDHFRHLDVLDEIAFFCLDLDLYNRMDLSQRFLDKYLSANPCLFTKEDQKIFLYYKMYRANVKVKVNMLKAMQAKDPEFFESRMKRARLYLNLMKGYLNELKADEKGRL